MYFTKIQTLCDWYEKKDNLHEEKKNKRPFSLKISAFIEKVKTGCLENLTVGQFIHLIY